MLAFCLPEYRNKRFPNIRFIVRPKNTGSELRSYLNCSDARAWCLSDESQSRYLIDFMKTDYDWVVERDKEGICATAGNSESQNDLPRDPGPKRQFSGKKGAKKSSRWKDNANTWEETKENYYKGSDMSNEKNLPLRHGVINVEKHNKDMENLRKMKDHSNFNEPNQLQIPSARATVNLPRHPKRVVDEEELNETIADIDHTVRNTINAMVAVLEAYVETAQQLMYVHEALEKKRKKFMSRYIEVPSYKFTSKEQKDALLYIDFALEDLENKLQQLYSMMESRDLPSAADHIFDLIEYFVEVESLYRNVLGKNDGQQDIPRDSLTEKQLDPIQIDSFEEVDSHVSSSHKTCSENFISSHDYETQKPYRFVKNEKPKKTNDENIQPANKLKVRNGKVAKAGPCSCAHPKNNFRSNLPFNLEPYRSVVNNIMSILTKLLCSLAAKPLPSKLSNTMPKLVAGSSTQHKQNKNDKTTIIGELKNIFQRNNEILNESEDFKKFSKVLLRKYEEDKNWYERCIAT